jgi:hypothetical protein
MVGVGAACWGLAAACGSASAGSAPAGPAVSASSAASAVVEQQVSGTVLSAPGCPGPQRAGSDCPPKAVPGATVRVEVGATTVATATTDTSGRFVLRLPSGTYSIVAVSPSPLRTTATENLVVAAAPVRIDLVVDSGMR